MLPKRQKNILQDLILWRTKVFQDFSQWSQEIPAVNYGNHTYAIESVLTESLQRVINGEDIDKVLEDAQTQVEAQIAN